MAYLEPNSPYVPETDASESRLGAVLYQEQNRKLRVIAYGSRTLTAAEKNYHIHSGKLEFLAMKWAICEQFQDYLYYAPSFVLFTDNNPLTYVLSTTKLNATGLRWVGELAEFFTILYRSGKANADADTLSRTSKDMNEYMKSCIQKTRQDELRTILSTVQLQDKGQVNWVSALTDDPDVLSADAAIQPDSNRLTFETTDIQKAQLEDTVIGTADKRPTANKRARESPDTRFSGVTLYQGAPGSKFSKAPPSRSAKGTS